MPPSASHKSLLSRESLAAGTPTVLRYVGRAKPVVYLIPTDDGPAIVKDFSRNFWLLRQTYGRWLAGREAGIYAHLDGVAGVPGFRGRIDAFAFAVDYVGGHTLKARGKSLVHSSFFEELDALLARIHEAGVVHLDSHQKSNVIVSEGGRPCLVDFATALYLGRGWLARRVLIPLFSRADRVGVLKLKARYCVEGLTADEARRLRRADLLGWLWLPTLVRRLARLARGRRRKPLDWHRRRKQSQGPPGQGG